jgi:hypothetical protein
MQNDNKVWPPAPIEPLPPNQPQISEPANYKTWALGRLVGGILGGFAAPAAAFWSGLLSFFVTSIEKTLGCENLEVCGQWYLPLYMLIGGLFTVVLGSICGGFCVHFVQKIMQKQTAE